MKRWVGAAGLLVSAWAWTGCAGGGGADAGGGEGFLFCPGVTCAGGSYCRATPEGPADAASADAATEADGGEAGVALRYECVPATDGCTAPLACAGAACPDCVRARCAACASAGAGCAVRVERGLVYCPAS